MTALELLSARVPDGVSALVEAGHRAERAARRQKARDLYERALRALPRNGSAGAACTLLRWIGRTHGEEGDGDAALDCYEVSLAVARAADDGVGMASAVNCKAIVAFGRGQLDEAERLWRAARRQARTHGAGKLVAMVEQNLGNVASIRGRPEVAFTRYRSALHTYRRLGMEDYLAPLLNNLGMLLTDMGRRDEAEETFAEGLRAARSTGNVSVEIVLETSRARLFVEEEEWDAARDRCDAAHELALRADDRRWLGEIFRYYGAVHRETGRPGLSAAYLDRARRLAEEHENRLLEAEVAQEVADLHRSRGRNRETLEALVRAHRIFSDLRAQRQLADVDRRLRRLEDEFLRITREWGESIESKDHYTQGHCQRVARYARSLARKAGLQEEYLVWFEMGALLHDVGKVAVPLEVLNKTDPLSDEEWAVLESHPAEGVRLLGDVAFPWDVRPMIRHHHERWDGSGYPDGLAGEEIPLAARILTVADVYDALTTDRAYRTAFSSEDALGIMEDETGTTFEPELLRLFREEVLAERPAGRATAGAFPSGERGARARSFRSRSERRSTSERAAALV